MQLPKLANNFLQDAGCKLNVYKIGEGRGHMFQAWSNKKFDPLRTKISNKDMYISVFEFMKSTVILNLKHG